MNSENAGVDVHVVGHVVVERGVGGDLDRGGGFAAEDGASAGREDADVGAAGDDAGHAHGVVAGRVHDDEALGLHGLGVADDVEPVLGPAFAVPGRSTTAHFTKV